MAAERGKEEREDRFVPRKKLAHSPLSLRLSRPSQNTQLGTTAAKVLSGRPPNIYLCSQSVSPKDRDDGTFQATSTCFPSSLLFLAGQKFWSRTILHLCTLPNPIPFVASKVAGKDEGGPPICCRSDIRSFRRASERTDSHASRQTKLTRGRNVPIPSFRASLSPSLPPSEEVEEEEEQASARGGRERHSQVLLHLSFSLPPSLQTATSYDTPFRFMM